MYNITICDDDGKILHELKQMIEADYVDLCVSCIQQLPHYIESLLNGRTALPDILIMDIKWENDELNGIERAVMLQNRFPKLKIIFLTGYIEYATDIFMARPGYFLTKPIQRGKLREAIDRMIEELSKESEQQLVIHSAGEVKVLNPADILYVESNKHEIKISCTDKDVRMWMKLDEILQQLPPSFIRIHQSFAVNAVYIQKFSVDGVQLMNGRILPTSRSRYTKAKEKFFDYLEGKLT